MIDFKKLHVDLAPPVTSVGLGADFAGRRLLVLDEAAGFDSGFRGLLNNADHSHKEKRSVSPLFQTFPPACDTPT